MAQIDQVADFIVRSLHESGDEVSNMKLQKLLYFAQALYLAEFQKPLFDEEMQAWKDGPVSPAVYRRFREFTHRDIQESALGTPGGVDLEEARHIEMVLNTFGGFTARVLRTMSHKSDPWLGVWRDHARDDRCEETISKESMREFFVQIENEIITSLCESGVDSGDEGSISLDELRRSLAGID